MMDDWGRHGFQDGGGFHWGIVVMVAALVALVAIVVLVLRSLERQRSSQTGTPQPEDSAVELLRRRLAAGEIDVAEFHERHDALESHPDRG